MITNFNSNRKDLASKIDFKLLFNKLEQAFAGLKDKLTVQPEQTALIAPNGDDCIIYSAADFANNIVGVKLSPYVAGRTNQNLNPVTAFTLLLSMKTGEPIILCDSFNLTAMRTAATSILAVSKLKPKQKKLAIIGFGAIGQEHLRCALIKFDWETVTIFSPKISIDNRIAIENINDNNLNPYNFNIEFAQSLDTAVENADVVMLCTSSKTEILDLSKTKDDCIITSIVTNSPTAHEVKPMSLKGCDIFCDYLPNSLTVAGEFKLLAELSELNSLNIKGDLSDLCNLDFASTVNPNARRYFRSVGLGIEDIVIANSLL
jgi:L-arginine dehydrogenase